MIQRARERLTEFTSGSPFVMDRFLRRFFLSQPSFIRESNRAEQIKMVGAHGSLCNTRTCHFVRQGHSHINAIPQRAFAPFQRCPTLVKPLRDVRMLQHFALIIIFTSGYKAISHFCICLQSAHEHGMYYVTLH